MFCGVSSPAGDWSVLLARLDRDGAYERWRRREPALADVGALVDLPVRLGRDCDRDAADRLIGALVRLAAIDGGDDLDAALLLVHLLSDGARKVAARCAGPASDALALVVGELTCQIRRFPWRRRTRAYASNLLLDTKHAVLQELPVRRADGARRELAVPPDHPVWDYPRSVDVHGAEELDLDLPALLGSLRSTEQISATDLRMLLILHEPAGYGTGGRHKVAAEFGINERTLRRRRDRALEVLREAGRQYLAEAAA